MSRKLIAALMALAAFAVTATPAAAMTLTEPTGTKLATGTTITITSAGEMSMTNLSGEKLIGCSKVHWQGTLRSNGPSAVITDITSATYKGTGAGETCTALFGTTATVTTAITGGLPYCLKTIEGTDKFEVRGGLCSEATRSIKYTIDFSDGGKCGYEKANLTGTFTTDVSGQDALLTTTKEGNFKRYEAEGSFSAFLCPSEAPLDMSLTLETTSGAPIYIS